MAILLIGYWIPCLTEIQRTVVAARQCSQTFFFLRILIKDLKVCFQNIIYLHDFSCRDQLWSTAVETTCVDYQSVNSGYIWCYYPGHGQFG